MDVKRIATRDEVEDGASLVEVVALTSGGGFSLLTEFSDDEASYLDGPFPDAATAEEEGVARAEKRGLQLLHVVTPHA